MSTAMPVLKSVRLTIRPFHRTDFEDIDRVLSDAWPYPQSERATRRMERERWLDWTIANYPALDRLSQPPYGDRAIVRNEDGALVGSIGVVPSLGPFGQLLDFPDADASRYFHPEIGLFWAVHSHYQRQGIATEAAGAVIAYLFSTLNLARVVATTEFDNDRSIGVMRKLGMRICRNPHPEPSWFQVVGVLDRTMKAN